MVLKGNNQSIPSPLSKNSDTEEESIPMMCISLVRSQFFTAPK